MSIILMILFGLIGGLIGGMGMGGGTLLIPLLTIFGGLSQHLAQSLNLITFIPMGIIALIIHAKNKLVDFKKGLIIILPAIGGAIIGAILSTNTDEELLGMCFGIFLVVLGIAQFISLFFMQKKPKNYQKNVNNVKK